jgi:hypothetical protein
VLASRAEMLVKPRFKLLRQINIVKNEHRRLTDGVTLIKLAQINGSRR